MSLLPTIAAYVPPGLIRIILRQPSTGSHCRSESFKSAALFADISGFTPLAEAFAQKGPEGQEELARLLNSYFSRMIRLIEAEGGEVVKFCGDALTVLFPAGEEPLGHATRRAYQAAESIRTGMSNFEITSPISDPISLELKMGLGAGIARVLEVGGFAERWEYVVAGDAVVQAFLATERSKRGDITLNSEAGVTIYPRSLDPRPLKKPDWTSIQNPGSVEDELRRFVPKSVLQWIDEGLHDWLAVLRPVSVLFAGIEGLDYSRPEVLEQLNTFLRDAQEIIDHYQGMLRQLVADDKGTVLLALFGAPPYAHEDDAIRAVRCALDLTSLVGQGRLRQSGLHLSAGVATGRVFAGPVGSETRREYAAIGDAVNLSSRLMVRARAGQVLVDFQTYRQGKGHLAFDDLAPIRVKGKAGLVRIYSPIAQSISSHSPHHRSHDLPSSQPALIGRETEKSRLEAALTALEAGESRIVVIEGEAGIGKSRLLAELTRMITERGLVRLFGAGQSIEQHSPYRAWWGIMISYFGLKETCEPAVARDTVRSVVDEIAPEQIQRLPLLNDILHLGLAETNLTSSLDAAGRHRSLVSFVVALLRAWAKERPLVLLLEDGHWLDSLSWELVVHVARGLLASGDALLLVVVTRPLDEESVGIGHLATLKGMNPAETLLLAGLSPDEIVTLATSRLDLPEGSLSDSAMDLVRTRAGGNPFFAEELAFTLRDQGLMGLEGENDHPQDQIGMGLDGTGQALPDTLQGLILGRIDRLSPEKQLTLKAASVIGSTFLYKPLHHALSQNAPTAEQPLEAQLHDLCRKGLIGLDAPIPDLAYAFRHVLTQEAAYHTLLFAQRRRLHRTVAEWYEETFPSHDEYFPLLVHHYHCAEDAESERRYAKLAGEQAAAQFANTEAIRYLSRALELTPADDLAERFSLLCVLQRVYGVLSACELMRQNLSVMTEIADTMGDDRRRAEVCTDRITYAEIIGDWPAAIDASMNAIEMSSNAGAVDLEVNGHYIWGHILAIQGDYENAQLRLEQALNLARVAQRSTIGLANSDDPKQNTKPLPVTEANALAEIGFICSCTGDYAGAEAYFRRAVSIFRDIGQRWGEGSCLILLGNLSMDRGDYLGARQFLERARGIFREVAVRRNEAMSLNDLGIVHSHLGEFSKAREYYDEVLSIFREIGDQEGEGYVLNNFGIVCSYQGEHVQAVAYHERSLEILRKIGSSDGEAEAIGSLGFARLCMGDYARAESNLRESVRLFGEIGVRPKEGTQLTYLGLLFHQIENNESAREYALKSLAIAQDIGDRSREAHALTVLAHVLLRLGLVEEAVGAYRQALNLRRQSSQEHLAMEPLAGLAGVALAQKDITGAQALVEEIMQYLQIGTLEGTSEPFQIYLTCYDILRANEDERAQEILEEAHNLLEERAAKIDDERARNLFLQNVAAHREILNEFSP